MEIILNCLKALGDENRLRIVMLLMERELCVCQLMGVIRISQPLVSKHLSVLKAAGIVQARKDGKLMIYSLSDEARSGGKRGLINLIKEALQGDIKVKNDLGRLKECTDLEKMTGRCDVEFFKEFARKGGVK